MPFVLDSVVTVVVSHGIVVVGTVMLYFKLGMAVRFGAVENHVSFIVVKMPQIVPDIFIIAVHDMAVDVGFMFGAGIVGHG